MPVAEAVNHSPADLMALLKSAMPRHFMSQLISDAQNSQDATGKKSMDPTSALTIKTEDLIKTENSEQKSPEEAVSSTSASSPMDSVSADDRGMSPSMSLPRESEHAERKRPAAIQELLQMKKARLSANDKPQKSPKKSMTTKEEAVSSTENSSVSSTPIPSTSGTLSDIFDRICHTGEEDNETTASSGSSHNGTDHPNPAAALLASFGVNNMQDSSVLMRALQQSVGAALKQQQAAIAAAMSAQVAATGQATPNRLSMASDNGVYEAPVNGSVSHDQVFAQVPGRLSLLSNVVKYKMTVGEVRRRLMGPEAFNFSLLGALLRRAKMPEKSQMLVEELAKVGLSIARGRRRLSQITLLSALTESESVQLAKDFHKIADQEFPAKKLAEYANQQFGKRASPEMLSLVNGTGMLAEKLNRAKINEERMQQLQNTKDMLMEFMELLGQDQSAVMDSNPEPILDPNVQDPLTQFSMLTHGFGTPAILVGMHMFANFIGNQIESLNEQQKQFNKKR